MEERYLSVQVEKLHIAITGNVTGVKAEKLK